MKTLFFLACFFLATNCSGQSLRDSLFGGKLKVDSALLKKSGMDKIQKATGDSTKKVSVDSTGKVIADSSKNQVTIEAPKTTSAQDNNKTWKKFVDEYTAIINTQTLPSKKVKKGIYSVLIEYEIGTDGVVTTKNITSTPSSDYLVEQIKEVMMPNAPQLAPLIRNGKAVKISRRQLLTFTKERN